jgi:hypothetical protein
MLKDFAEKSAPCPQSRLFCRKVGFSDEKVIFPASILSIFHAISNSGESTQWLFLLINERK